MPYSARYKDFLYFANYFQEFNRKIYVIFSASTKDNYLEIKFNDRN